MGPDKAISGSDTYADSTYVELSHGHVLIQHLRPCGRLINIETMVFQAFLGAICEITLVFQSWDVAAMSLRLVVKHLHCDVPEL